MTAPQPVIRRLTEATAAAFRDIRLDALRTAPEAFGSSYDSEKDRPEADFAATLGRNYVAGAWLGSTLVGTAGYYPLTGPKLAHRGNIWGVFVRPDHRGAGIARVMIEHLLAVARDEVLQVHLSVVTTNAAAIALYQRLGFSTYGTEPRSLQIGGRFFDEHLMVKRFDEE
jgi:ribosomal protein S18 acetylase RimI-like enzyme